MQIAMFVLYADLKQDQTRANIRIANVLNVGFKTKRTKRNQLNKTPMTD